MNSITSRAPRTHWELLESDIPTPKRSSRVKPMGMGKEDSVSSDTSIKELKDSIDAIKDKLSESGLTKTYKDYMRGAKKSLIWTGVVGTAALLTVAVVLTAVIEATKCGVELPFEKKKKAYEAKVHIAEHLQEYALRQQLDQQMQQQGAQSFNPSNQAYPS